ncbi:MAG: YncE family protein [Pseudomonadota bacterium]|nr:YncE family protein [Pseudomonadota bacterium]
MRSRFTLVRRAALTVIVAIGIGVVALLGYLVYPGTPAAAHTLKFERYIPLQRHGVLNILDYLTIQGNTLFVAGTSSGSVYQVPLASQAASTTVTVAEFLGNPHAHGVALVPSANLAFVTRSGDNVVDIFEPGRLGRLGSLPVAEDPDAILFVEADNLVYVANGDARLATLIDPTAKSIVGTIALEGEPEFAVYDRQEDVVYQNLKDTHSIAEVSLRKRLVINRWPLDSCEIPTGLALDVQRRRLFVACGRSAKLVIFDLVNHRIVASLAIGGGPDSVAYDASLRRIYSAGTSGQLSVIQQDDADTYRLLENIPTHPGAHTLALDSVSHKVYVGYAGLFVAPRVAVFSTIN